MNQQIKDIAKEIKKIKTQLKTQQLSAENELVLSNLVKDGEALKVSKIVVLNDEKVIRKQRDVCDVLCKQSRVVYNNFRKSENEIRKKRGKQEKSLRKIIEETLAENKAPLSSYHGGDMEGNAIRRLMHEGPAIFLEIKNAIILYCGDRVNDDDYSSRPEIEQVCNNYGKLLLLMDAVLALLNTEHGQCIREAVASLF